VPLKSGLPSAVRGTCDGFAVDVFWAESGVITVSAPRASISNSQRVYRSIMTLSGESEDSPLLGLLIGG
jgi:hypothetical protein